MTNNVNIQSLHSSVYIGEIRVEVGGGGRWLLQEVTSGFKNNFLKNSIRINISVAIELVSVFFSF